MIGPLITEQRQTVDSEHLLEAARNAWASTREEFRDNAIRVGHLLHRFVVARLTEATTLTTRQRLTVGITRANAINDAAKRLDVPRHHIYRLIRVAMVVALLCDDGNLGKLSYGSLRRLSVFVQRKSNPIVKKLTERSSVTNREEWMIVERNGLNPKSLFREAVIENWNMTKIGEIVATFRREKTGKRGGGRPSSEEMKKKTSRRYAIGGVGNLTHHEFKEGEPPRIALQQIAKEANAKDLIDIILSLVRLRPDSKELSARLKESL